MATPEERLEEAADMAEAATAIATDWANGPSRNVIPEPLSGPLPTIRKFLDDKAIEIDDNANLIAAFEAELAQEGSEKTISGSKAFSLVMRANIENYGALTSASAAANATAINSAISANGFAYVPKRSASFATNLSSSFDFSLLRGEGVISVSSGATINLSLTKSPIYNNQPMPLMARYYGGEAVKFAAYGDSIVESVGSTGHTANTGLSSFAPNYAWPTLLQHLARQQIGSGNGDTNFICGNAGYGGQRLDNGWAFDNFKSKVLDVYVGSQCLLLAFGHNDGNAAGFNTANYIKQLKNMILLCRGNGIEPVILSTIPCGRPRGQDIYNEITSVQQQVCQELGVLFYAVYSKFKRLIDYYGYFTLITSDGVHPTDKGYNSLACAIYSEVFRPLVHHGDGKLSLWEPQAKGLFYAGNADAAWAGNLSIYIENLSSVDLNIRYATAKGASATLGAIYHWCDSPKKQKLVYRAPFPAENVAAGSGMACQYASLTDGIFYTPSGITYTTIPDAGGRRRGVVDSADMAFLVADEAPVGMSFIVITTGSGNTSVAYAGHFEFTETTERSFYAAEANDRQGAQRSQFSSKGASLYRLPALAGGVSYQLENENADLTNIASFSGVGTQITINAGLIESRGFVLMSGEKINSDGSGKWIYAIVRGLTGAATISDPTKIYLVRWQTGDAAATIVATASVATTQDWADINLFISLDSSGDNYRVRVWDGLNSAAPLMLTYTSTTVTNATTTRAECIPAAGVAGGGFAMGTVLGNEVPILIKSFTVERFT